MRLAYVLFSGITLLDFVGFYDPISRLKSQGYLPDLSWDLCAYEATVADGFRLGLTIDRVRPDLGEYDMIFVPGGFGSRRLVDDADWLDWLRTAAPVPLKVSVCTGSLLLGAAGFLAGRRATTHFSEYDALQQWAGEVVRGEIVVEDDGIITGGAVASSLELGLYVVEKLAGPQGRGEVRRAMGLPIY